MLQAAFLYADVLQKEYQKIVYQDKYFYLIENIWDYEIKLYNSDEHALQFVSVNEKNQVIGFFQANINRYFNTVTGLEVINFNEINFCYSKDFHTFINQLLYKHNFRKVSFEVIAGSPYEKLYNKHLARFNGRVVGIKKNEVMLSDGKYYDVKLYELFPKAVLLYN